MSNFPNAIDTDLELPRVDLEITEISGDSINALRDAIFAIERAIGINPQGNLATMVARVNEVIDNNGLLKTSALEGRGLITLPISNSQIDTNAAIEESKLDLDYTTSAINTKINQNISDTDSIRDALNVHANDFIKHFSSTATRHDGYGIDLDVSVRGQTTVEAGLHTLDVVLANHESLVSDAHNASAVSVVDTFNRISASNVQTALEGLDAVDPGVEEHQDKLHSAAIVINNRVESGQANKNIATLATTIYQTDKTGTSSPDALGGVTNIVQVMQPNVARVTSLNINMRGLEIASADKLRIQAGGIGRSYLDIDLAAIVGTADIDGLVILINVALRAAHYPIAAYNTGGELTLAHNMLGDDYTVNVLDTITNSAHTELGFGDVIGTTFYYTGSQHSAYISGNRVFGLQTLLDIAYDHTTAVDLNRIEPGLGDLNDFGIAAATDPGRILVHITNHSTDSTYNGTYYIQTYFGNNVFDINANIPNGTFNLKIISDSTNFVSSSRGVIYDIFVENAAVDGYGLVTTTSRISYLGISGLHIKEVSDDFTIDNPKWSFNSDETLQIRNGLDGDPTYGEAVLVNSGFLGALKVFASDGSSAIIEVTGVPGVVVNRDIDSVAFAGTDDRLYVSSVHYSDTVSADNKTVQFPQDKRQFGAVNINEYKNALGPTPLEDAFGELRSNGVIRGLDVLDNTTTTVKLRGGRVLIDGRLHHVVNQNVTIEDFTSGTHLLAIDKNGKYQVFSGDNFDDLVGDDAYGNNRSIATITEFVTDGSVVTGAFADRRLLLSNIDLRVAQLEGSGASSDVVITSTGSAAAPGYTFVGDLNTGMYSPGPDSIGFSTAGTERVVIDSAGQLGIGVSAPTDKLSVDGNINVSGVVKILESEEPPQIDGYSQLWVVDDEYSSLMVRDGYVPNGSHYLVPNYAEMYMTTPASVAISSNVYSKCAGITGAGQVHGNFLVGSGNRVIYTGIIDVWVTVNCAVSMTTGGNVQIATLAIFKNGVLVGTSPIDRKIGTGSDVGALAVQCMVPLSTNDYVELWGKVNTNTTLTIEKLNMIVKA